MNNPNDMHINYVNYSTEKFLGQAFIGYPLLFIFGIGFALFGAKMYKRFVRHQEMSQQFHMIQMKCMRLRVITKTKNRT